MFIHSMSKGIGGDLVSKVIHQSHAARVVKLSTVIDGEFQSRRPSAVTASTHNGYWQDSCRGALQWLMWGFHCILVQWRVKSNVSENTCAHSISAFLDSIVAFQETSRRFVAWDFLSDAFVQLTPWCSHLADVKLYGGAGNSLKPVEASDALVGSVVGLAIFGSGVASAECLGLGIVRSFNLQTKMLYILTPLSPTQLSVVDAVVLRDVNFPSSFKMANKTLIHQSPYESCNGLTSEGTGAGVMRSRNNLLRASAFK